MNKNKRVADLTIGDTFVNTATRHTVTGIRTAEMSVPTAKRYMQVETETGSFKIPADLLVKIVA